MTITAQDIQKLRQRTGAGIMAAKQALTEANGDSDKALELLRKKGQKIADKRASKVTTEGLVLAKVNEKAGYGVIIALSCETDFVANNEAFRELAQNIVTAALEHQPTSLEALIQLEVAGHTFQEEITSLIGKMGENITLSAYDTLSSQVVVPYVHLGSKLGVLVALQGAQGTHIVEAGSNIAMQIAAMNPIAIDEDGVDPAIAAQELGIAREQASQEENPSAILEEIAQDELQKFYKEKTLLSQLFIKNNKLTVAQYLTQVDPKLTITSFKRIVVGS
jgi:elongation factor Ts